MADFEQEVTALRDTIRDAEKRHASERAAADKVRADLRASGVDFAKDKDAFDKVDEAYRSADALRDEISDLRSREARIMEIAGHEVRDATNDGERDARRGSVADRFLRSKEYQEVLRSGSLSMVGARIHSNPVEVQTRDELLAGLRMRTTVDNSAGSGGGVIWSDRREDLIVPTPVRRISVLDVITIGTTDSDTVEWTKETTTTDAAAETAYGTAASEAAYGWTKQSTTVKRIPHFVPATKGSLADSGQLRTLLTSRLQRGVNLRVETQVVAGDGTGDNLTGIKVVSGTGSIALGSDTRFDAVHKAITNVRTNAYTEPGVIGLHPSDYEDLVLEKDADGNYVHGRSASEASVTTVWGLVPVVSTVFSTGTAVVGDYSEAVLWLRDGVSVAMSDSHSDFFTKGLVAILAEARAAFAVLQPKAFCKITGF